MKIRDLEMWCIYDSPADYPNKTIARKFLIGAKGGVATDVIISDPLPHLRKRFESQGLVCIGRASDDDPVIVETWM